MKKLLVWAMCIIGLSFATYAISESVVVKASVEATVANSRAKNECVAKAKKLAVEKYLRVLDQGMADTIVKKAVLDYKKYVDEVEASEGDCEDGEFTCEYRVTIKREPLMTWLATQGWKLDAGARDANGNAVSVDIVIAEEPPDVGAMKVAAAFGTGLDGKSFFFTRYTEFQKKVRDALSENLNAIGIQVPSLEDNPAYAEIKKNDPCCMGVYFDPGVGANGEFKITPNFLELIKSNNPDSMVLYYRISSLIYETEQRKAIVDVAISIKNLASGKTITIGHAPNERSIDSKQQDMIMSIMAQTVEGGINKVLSGGNAAGKIIDAIKTLKADAAKPAGPMKVVINMSNVDKKIVDEVMIELEDKVVEKGLCKDGAVKTTGSSMSFVMKDGAVKNNDPKRTFVAIKKAMIDAGLPEEEVQGDCKTFSNGVMTITPGKTSVQ